MALLDRISAQIATPPSDDIVMVAIDDRSLAAVGQWPWDRRQVAQLIDRLTADGAKAVVLDVLYVEPSDPDADKALVDAIARSGRVALPYTFTAPQNRSFGADRLPLLPGMEAAALVTGQVAIEPDSDGLVRRFPITYSDGPNSWPHLQASLYHKLSGHPPIITGGVIPLRHADSYRSISASVLLAGEVPPATFGDKVVFIGATAPGLGDLFPVSRVVGSMMAGPELQANLYQSIAENRFIQSYPSRSKMVLNVIAILFVFLGFWRLRPSQGLILAMGMIALLVLGSVLLLTLRLAWFAPGSGVLALLFAYPLWGWRRLAAVSAFLSTKVATLSTIEGTPTDGEGFDAVARQASSLSFLVDRLDERHRFLRRVLEASPEAMCAFGSNGELVLANQQATRLFGSATGGQQLQDLVLSSGARFNDDQSELVFPGGGYYSISRSSAEGPDAIEGLRVITFADISEIRRAENDRREMLGFLSHDMRSPQVAILGLTKGGAGSSDIAERLIRIEDNARRTLSLADNFVQISRLAEVPLDFEEIDLVSLVAEAIDRTWQIAREKHTKVEMCPGPEIAFLQGDGRVLSRVLDNLIGNAIKYCPKGSVVSISIAELAHGWHLSIADNGPGLPPTRRETPFQRFGEMGSGGGSGLGLAFVQAAIEKHGGSVQCRSHDAGTTFEIDLPSRAVTDQ